MPHYSPVKPGRHPWHSAAILYDKHGQELDYHDDVSATTDSQECESWSDYFCQQGNKYGVQLADSLDAEHRLLQGPTMTSTVSEEAVLLEEETAYRGHEAVFSGTGNPHTRNVERSLYAHQTLVPAGGPIGVHQIDAKGITSAPSRPTCHTAHSQSHGAGPVESDEQPWNVTSLPAYAHTPSRCGRDQMRHHPPCRTNVEGARNAVPEAEAQLTLVISYRGEDRIAMKTKPPTIETEHYFNHAIPVS